MRLAMPQKGFSLLELLVSLVVFSIGLLGIAGLQMMSKQASYEGIQRTLASQVANGLLEDMRTNGSGISVYTAANDLGGGSLAGLPVSSCRNPDTPCTPAQKAVHDLSHWEQLVDGDREMGAEGATGGVLEPTVCIDGPAGGVAGVYSVSVSWRGGVELANPELSQCGVGTGKYGANDAYRRVITVSTFIDPTL